MPQAKINSRSLYWDRSDCIAAKPREQRKDLLTMPTSRQAEAQVVRREEKFDRLRAFLGEALAGIEAGVDGVVAIDVIARSVASPVIQALSTALADITDTRVAVRVVISRSAEPGGVDTALPACDVRLLVGTHFEDAHEQLVVGGASVWIGDSMRRDPVKLDAYERFSAGDVTAARWATVAFNRLWSLARANSASTFRPRVSASAPTAHAVSGWTTETLN